MYPIQHYVIKFVSDLLQVGGFIHQLNWPPRYNWNIVESGIKHHKPTNRLFFILFVFLYFSYCYFFLFFVLFFFLSVLTFFQIVFFSSIFWRISIRRKYYIKIIVFFIYMWIYYPFFIQLICCLVNYCF